MDPVTAKRVLALVDRCVDLVSGAKPDPSRSSETSLSLYQLHSAAILGAAVSYLVVPIYRENPELQPAGGGQPIAAFRMSREEVNRALEGLTGVKAAMNDARSAVQQAGLTADERDTYLSGIERVLGYVEEAVDVISRQREEVVRD